MFVLWKLNNQLVVNYWKFKRSAHLKQRRTLTTCATWSLWCKLGDDDCVLQLKNCQQPNISSMAKQLSEMTPTLSTSMSSHARWPTYLVHFAGDNSGYLAETMWQWNYLWSKYTDQLGASQFQLQQEMCRWCLWVDDVLFYLQRLCSMRWMTCGLFLSSTVSLTIH